jgi:metallo-beta-lactamase family protein
MKVTLFGAAGNVTGSAYYIETGRANLLVDFGMFQGENEDDAFKQLFPPINCSKLNAVLLTHAHLDHCGRLPLLVRNNYSNPIYATQSTIELAELVLRDSVKVQTNEINRANKKRLQKGLPQIQMPYSEDDVDEVMKLFCQVPYNKSFEIAEGSVLIAHDSGHILGSVSYELNLKENGKTKKIIFSGDVGPYDMAIIQDPETFAKADLVIMESTYGNRDHKSQEETIAEGLKIINKAIRNGGKILVPAFAIGRTQQLLYYMARAEYEGQIPDIPIYLDSPMGIDASRIYGKHIELYDEEARHLISLGALKTDMSDIFVCKTPEQSKGLNLIEGPCMIIAGSGMCNAGRILHHLRHNLSKPETSVIIPGYQGKGTLGRRLVEGAETVRIFGDEVEVKASIHTMNGLSAHAGQSDLLRWFHPMAASKPRLVLSHGEDRAREPLAQIIREKYGIDAILPEYGEEITL